MQQVINQQKITRKEGETMTAFKQEFYTPLEAANLLRVHRNTIYNMIRRGELEYYRIGTDIRITAEELEKKLKVSAKHE